MTLRGACGGAGLHYTPCLFLDNELRSVFLFPPPPPPLPAYRIGKDLLIPDLSLEAKPPLQLLQCFFLFFLHYTSRSQKNQGSVCSTPRWAGDSAAVGVYVHIIALRRPAWRWKHTGSVQHQTQSRKLWQSGGAERAGRTLETETRRETERNYWKTAKCLSNEQPAVWSMLIFLWIQIYLSKHRGLTTNGWDADGRLRRKPIKGAE